MTEFKVGDKVYFPSEKPRIYTLVEGSNPEYPLRIEEEFGRETFTKHGYLYAENALPSIFLATEENHKKLSDLYGIAFEKPPKVDLPREVIKAMLNDGWNYVPCFVSDGYEIPSEANCIDLITALNAVSYKGIGTTWLYATPIDPKTGKTIISYSNGKVITD